ncbi:AAA family ATPase [Haloarculaceae archaeon H-GB2-1]|nr:AAA family ATPase [Haloarculaceae archaeon H-GB11]MEA5408346.1 AAA family ATPase [Haloarculaceae archaeon H-GB2-1]
MAFEDGVRDGDDGDELFESIDDSGGNNIFSRRELLDIDHVPDENRIVGRDEQIQDLAKELGPAVSGAPPNSVIIYGKTGSGKSLVTKHVMERARDEADRRGNRLATATVDCSQAKGEADTVQEIATQVNHPSTGVHIPREASPRTSTTTVSGTS